MQADCINKRGPLKEQHIAAAELTPAASPTIREWPQQASRHRPCSLQSTPTSKAGEVHLYRHGFPLFNGHRPWCQLAYITASVMRRSMRGPYIKYSNTRSLGHNASIDLDAYISYSTLSSALLNHLLLPLTTHLL